MARIQCDDAERMLGRVPDEHVFRCSDGRIMTNMQELADAFTYMSEETFAYHCNEQKQDFSNWVRYVMGDQKLARDLARSINRLQAAKRVEDRVAFLCVKAVPV